MTLHRPGRRIDGEIDPKRLLALHAREFEAWVAGRPKAKALHERAQRSQLHGTPQHWVDQFPPPFPIVVERAEAAVLHDTDGHRYADLGLCGTAALWGHSNPPLVAALRDQAAKGTVTGWQSEDHVWVTEELARRFGLPYWQFTVSATDANRFALRIARVATGRQKILVFNAAYHGSVDQTHAVISGDGVVPTPGVARNGVDVDETTKVVEFNDLDALEAALAPGDVAAVLAEPAMTNGGGIVWPAEGFHAGLRELTRRHGTLLIVDETQSIPAGPSGCTGLFGLEPDLFTVGKCIAGGIPAGVWGMSEEVAAAAARYTRVEGMPVNHGGFGSTLAGGELALRAMRVVLSEIATEESYAEMARLASRYEQSVAETIERHGLPWHVGRLGGRASYAFIPEPPVNAGQLGNHTLGPRLREAIWLHLANRGVAIGCYGGTAIFSPMTAEADVDLHNDLFAELIGELTGA